jgi:predicted aldo/keto reductase-like oxidoreductase
MRLPTRNGEVNADEAVRMLRYAINHGVNYCDTAFGYHGGNSERVLGLALRDGYRERVRVATKLPCWLINSPDDFDKHLDIQLERLGTGYVDFYLLHALNRNQWMHMRDLGVIPWAESAIRDGRIQHLGFSFHDNTEAFKEIVDAYDGWTLAQIQYNFMDVENQAGTEGLRYAASKGLAVVIMEPRCATSRRTSSTRIGPASAPCPKRNALSWRT